MVDKKVQFNIVVGGIPQIKSALKGVTESARSMNLSIQQMHERTTQRITELERNKASALKRINETIIDNEEAKARRIAQIEENVSRQVTAIKEREALRAKHINERFIMDAQNQAAKGLDLRQIGRFASMSGFHRTAQAINWADQLGIGSRGQKSGGSTGGGGGGADIASLLGKTGGAEAEGAAAGGAEAGAAAGAAGLGIAAAAAAVAIVGVVVAAKAVEIGFEVVSGQAKLLATSFLGAAAQIGGFKNLQETIVGGAQNQRTAAQIAAASPNFVGTAQVQDLIKQIREGTEFNQEETGKAIRKYQEKTGALPTLEMGKFLTKGATATGTNLDQFTEQYARIRTQFRTLPEKDIQDIVLRTIAQGMTGTVEFMNMNQAGALTGKAQGLEGKVGENVARLIGYAQLVEPGAGSPQEAFTQEEAFLNRVGEIKATKPEFAKKLGITYKDGKMQNIDKVIENAVIEYKKDPSAFAHQLGGRVEAKRFIEGLSNLTTGKTEEEQRTSFQTTARGAISPTMGLDEMDRRFKEVANTADYKLKATFGDLANIMGTALLPILESLVPDIKIFAEAIVQNKDLITDAIKNMINSLLALVPAALEFGKALASLGVFFGIFMQVLGKSLDFMTGGLFTDTLKPFIEAGDKISKSQANLFVVFDKLTASAEKLQEVVDKIQVPDKPITIPEVTIVGEAHNKEVVKAIKDMHHDLKSGLHKQPL